VQTLVVVAETVVPPVHEELVEMVTAVSHATPAGVQEQV
jgi:hypothetical protein